MCSGLVFVCGMGVCGVLYGGWYFCMSVLCGLVLGSRVVVVGIFFCCMFFKNVFVGVVFIGGMGVLFLWCFLF